MKEKITIWVSVKDKLPSEQDEYIPCYSKQVLCRLNCGLLEICQYDFTNKRWLKYDNLITHWMSIPELKEEQPMEEKITAWIARDEDEEIHVYTTEPWKLGGQWVTNDNGIDKNKFPQVKWEDKEPTKVELMIKIKTN